MASIKVEFCLKKKKPIPSANIRYLPYESWNKNHVRIIDFSDLK